MPADRVDQTTAPGVLRNHEARIRALEATPSAPDGIQFGGSDTPTYGPENSGDWLYVATSNATGSPNDYGIDFEDTSGEGFLVNTNGGFTFNDDSGFGFLSTEGGDGGYAIFNEGAGPTRIINRGSGDVEVVSQAGISLSDTSSNPVELQQNGGGGITVQDNGAGGITLEATDTGGAGITLTSAPSSGDNARLQLLSPSVGGDLEFFFGSDGPAVSHNPAFDQITIYGGSASDNVTVWENIVLNAFQGSNGDTATYFYNTVVTATPALQLPGIGTEPAGTVMGGTATILYTYNDGSGHPKLKAYFPGTGVRVLLATG